MAILDYSALSQGVVGQHTLLRRVVRRGFSDSEKGFVEGSQRVLRRCLVVVLKEKRGVSEGFSEGVLRRGASRRCLECPVGEYDPL